jgi:hypothetical protein
VIERPSAKHGDRVVDDRIERGEAIGDAARRAWQVDD